MHSTIIQCYFFNSRWSILWNEAEHVKWQYREVLFY